MRNLISLFLLLAVSLGILGQDVNWSAYLVLGEVITASSKNIATLKGLEMYRSLKNIYLNSNQIRDLSPLKDFDQ